MSDECALCGCNGSACSGCHEAEEPPLTEAEIDELERIYVLDEEMPQDLADSLEEAGRFA